MNYSDSRERIVYSAFCAYLCYCPLLYVGCVRARHAFVYLLEIFYEAEPVAALFSAEVD